MGYTSVLSNSNSNRQWCHWIGHIRFPVRFPLQTCLYILQRFRDFITYFPKFKGHVKNSGIRSGERYKLPERGLHGAEPKPTNH